jgi:transposase
VLSGQFEIQPNQVSTGKSEFLANASTVFESTKSASKEVVDNEGLYKVIGQQKVEIDFLKLVLDK